MIEQKLLCLLCEEEEKAAEVVLNKNLCNECLGMIMSWVNVNVRTIVNLTARCELEFRDDKMYDVGLDDTGVHQGSINNLTFKKFHCRWCHWEHYDFDMRALMLHVVEHMKKQKHHTGSKGKYKKSGNKESGFRFIEKEIASLY